MSLPSLAPFASRATKLGFSIEFQYGSGGYHIIIRDLFSNGKLYAGISGDIDGLVESLVEQMLIDRIGHDEEVTEA